MKKIYHLFTVLGLVLLLSACEKTNPIEGTWILVKGSYVTEDNTLNYPVSDKNKRLKVVGKTHFATVWQDPDNDAYCGYNGGTYELKDGIYTENLEYFNENKFIGTKSYFLLSIDGDIITITACNAMGEEQEYGFFEEWKKIE